jgi:hypothetical protein
MGESTLAFGLYLSCVTGQPVARFGSRVLIGAERDLTDRTEIHYRPEVIVGIPTAEARQYAREYRRAISDGSVLQRTAEDWIKQQTSPEAGAPRIELTAVDPPEDESEAHGHPESSSKLGQDTGPLPRR